jgi:hypothetical protein
MRVAPVSASAMQSWSDCGDRLQPLATAEMPLDVPPLRTSRSG